MVIKYVLFIFKKKTKFNLILIFKVAEIHKKRFHLHDTYSVEIEADQDPAIILLLAIGIDEIRQH
jgi:hypothetical protein